jgi:hypothetical protein
MFSGRNKHEKEHGCFKRYVLLSIWLWVAVVLLEFHTNLLSPLFSSPITAIVGALLLVFAGAVREVMLLALVGSIIFMLTGKKIDYLMLLLMIFSFCYACFLNISWVF